MKIAQLCLSPDLGGLELYVYKLATFLGENCLSYINANGKLLPYYQDSNLFFRQLKTKYKFNLLVNAKKLASWIDKDQIDILHIHWTKDLPLAVLAKLFSKKKPKLVHTRHMQMVGSKDDFFHRFLYSHVDKMIAITDQLKDQMECFLPKKNRPEIIRLYIGAQAPIILNKSIINEKRNHLGLKQDTFTVGIIGRIEEAKGQHVVLDPLLALDNEKINIKGLVVGGAMDDKYFSFIKEKYAKVAHFLGFTKEAQMTMQLCDVVVLAT
jgi:glycosyltransferase involved in cell wall biosynthesis